MKRVRKVDSTDTLICIILSSEEEVECNKNDLIGMYSRGVKEVVVSASCTPTKRALYDLRADEIYIIDTL
jgi:hypothetical protein